MLPRAPHERDAPRWLYYVLVHRAKPWAPEVLYWGIRPDSGVWTEGLLLERHRELLVSLRVHDWEKLGNVEVWVVGRPQILGRLGRDPLLQTNFNELHEQLDRWQNDEPAFQGDPRGLRIFPAEVLDAWVDPRWVEFPSDTSCAVWLLNFGDEPSDWFSEWHSLEAYASKQATWQLEMHVADASFAPDLVPAGFVVRASIGRWVEVIDYSVGPRRRHWAADNYAVDAAFRGAVLADMPSYGGVVLPGQPIENRVEASEKNWIWRVSHHRMAGTGEFGYEWGYAPGLGGNVEPSQRLF